MKSLCCWRKVEDDDQDKRRFTHQTNLVNDSRLMRASDRCKERLGLGGSPVVTFRKDINNSDSASHPDKSGISLSTNFAAESSSPNNDAAAEEVNLSNMGNPFEDADTSHVPAQGKKKQAPIPPSICDPPAAALLPPVICAAISDASTVLIDETEADEDDGDTNPFNITPTSYDAEKTSKEAESLIHPILKNADPSTCQPPEKSIAESPLNLGEHSPREAIEPIKDYMVEVSNPVEHSLFSKSSTLSAVQSEEYATASESAGDLPDTDESKPETGLASCENDEGGEGHKTFVQDELQAVEKSSQVGSNSKLVLFEDSLASHRDFNPDLYLPSAESSPDGIASGLDISRDPLEISSAQILEKDERNFGSPSSEGSPCLRQMSESIYLEDSFVFPSLQDTMASLQRSATPSKTQSMNLPSTPRSKFESMRSPDTTRMSSAPGTVADIPQLLKDQAKPESSSTSQPEAPSSAEVSLNRSASSSWQGFDVLDAAQMELASIIEKTRR